MRNDATIAQGNLFTRDFLGVAIRDMPEWVAIGDAELDAFASTLRGIFGRFPVSTGPNEAHTEEDLIWPVLAALDWHDYLRQQNLAAKGRDDVPDGLLFGSAEAKAQANLNPEQWRRYGLGLAIVESKRWDRPLDRRASTRKGAEEQGAPSTQMLRYLRRAEDFSAGKLRWGILTNGGRWRLYYQGAKSVSEDFFELDLARVLDSNAGLAEEDRRHWLKVFLIVFGRRNFLHGDRYATTFHQRALEQGRFYEERVAKNLSGLVYERIFPELAKAISAAAPEAALEEVRNAALILLYRLLFLLYAEDRNLLPVGDARYDGYSLRSRVRQDVGQHKDRKDTFSASAARYWAVIEDLTRAIDKGDPDIGLPPYNGGLFDPERTPLLTRIRLGDAVVADVVDALSFEATDEGRRYINYRDLSVQQLGSIYERLLEREIVREAGVAIVRQNIFARKNSGSYYTPDDLVRLIVRETLDPLVADRLQAFRDAAEQLASDSRSLDLRVGLLRELDPAERLLELKICDPAMGSGHFLVTLVDYLSDQVIAAMAEAEAVVTWTEYESPLAGQIANIRHKILANAERNRWTVNLDQLDDRHIIRRMVLKRCVYGVDKNGMAVELAKMSLWLHTFTVGAPLSFLDHHLRPGDSLFGGWVSDTMDAVLKRGGKPLLLHRSITQAKTSASAMQLIERQTDAEIAEARNSAQIFDGIQVSTEALDGFMGVLHALDWLNPKDKASKHAIRSWLDGVFGDPVEVALGRTKVSTGREDGALFAGILAKALELVAEQNFLNWQVAFPGVWEEWETEGLTGGFDAVIGNPPWDRLKLEQVEWFASRRPEIALATRASDRARMIKALETLKDPLAAEYAIAADRAETAARVARDGGDYPLLSGGDVNLYSLFVERAMTLARPEGLVGLLTPSGIASDKNAAPFFKGVATSGRLKALYDFENKKVFFPEVHASFKFCAFVASPYRTFPEARCAFYMHSTAELADPERCFPLAAQDFARVNPNTGTAPIFRTQRDAAITAAIYERLPVLIDRSGERIVKAWPVRYTTMFHMTNDSGLFHTRNELEEQDGAYPIGGNRWRSPSGDWVPLYEGKMVQAYDHRAASVVVNERNLNRPAQPMDATEAQHADPEWLPSPQYWVSVTDRDQTCPADWYLAFKEITAPTNVRTFIAAALPSAGFGNKLPLLLPDGERPLELLLGNLNSIPFDYATRQKIQGQTLNLFIVEQLPVVPADTYETTKFGAATAAEIVRQAVLELTYTATDMAAFARDMGYMNADGTVKPPFPWDDHRRAMLRAKLDAVYFLLYGVMDRDDVRYIYSTFPIVEREETRKHGRYLSRDLCLAWMNALTAGHPDADIRLD